MMTLIKKVCDNDRTTLIGIIVKRNNQYYYIIKDKINNYTYTNATFDKVGKLRIDKSKMNLPRDKWIIFEPECNKLLEENKIERL